MAANSNNVKDERLDGHEKGGDDDFAIGVLNDVEFMVCFFPWVILPV